MTLLEDSRFSAAEAKPGASENNVKGKKRGTNNEPIGLTSLSYYFVFRPALDTACHWIHLRPAHGTAPHFRFPVLFTRFKDVAANFFHTPLSCTKLHGVMLRLTAFTLFFFFYLCYSFHRSCPSAVPLLISLYFLVSCFTLYFHSFQSFFL